MNEIRRDRTRAGLGRAGRLLGDSFLPGPVAGELQRVLGAAVAAHQPVRLGLAVPTQWAGLPWEALPRPGRAGPLALHPLVGRIPEGRRGAGAAAGGAAADRGGDRRPDTGGGAVLDYERELRNVLAAVRAARQDAADVRVVPFATPAAIRAELDRARRTCCT